MKILKKIKNIIIGTWNNIFKRNNKLAVKRLAICYNCECCLEITQRTNICTKCGCVLESKTRVDDEKCLLNLW